ncbi:unnamed protein product, partial [Phaeothamnion confervicola]
MERVLAQYKPGKELARGGFATVFSCTYKKTGEQFALKLVQKRASENDREGRMREAFLFSEVEILRLMQHPKVVAFREFFELPKAYALVMELMPGGELFERIQKKSFYSEDDARTLTRNLLEAVSYLHDNKVVHRDLKPENIMMADLETDTHIKVVDFGLSKRLQGADEVHMRTLCGTPEYCAPELHKAIPYTKAVDVFAVGVIAYIMVSGYHPYKRFRARDGTLQNDQARVVTQICAGKLEFHREYWSAVSDECKDLIGQMLHPDPGRRLPAAAALHHPWFEEDAEALASHDLHHSIEEIRAFNIKRHLRGAISAVIGIRRMDAIAKTFASHPPTPAGASASTADGGAGPPPPILGGVMAEAARLDAEKR